MQKLRALWMRLGGLMSGRTNAGRAEQDFAAELESHIDLHTEDGIRAGLTPDEARRRALIKLVLLCYNRLTPQNGHWQSWRSRERARMMRKVAMECGLCLSGRMRTSGFEVGRQFGR